MAIFNIPWEGRPDLQVEGLKVANSVGVYHPLEVILSESGACVAGDLRGHVVFQSIEARAAGSVTQVLIDPFGQPEGSRRPLRAV